MVGPPPISLFPTDGACAGENGAQFEFEFEDTSKQVVERASQPSLSSVFTFLSSLTHSLGSLCQELVEPALAQLWPCENVSFNHAFPSYLCVP